MDVRTRWRRVPAEHWILMWGRTVTSLLAIVGLVAAMAASAGGLGAMLVVATFWGLVTSLAGWLTAAWRDGTPWSWWVWTVGTTVLFVAGVSGLVVPSWLTVPWLLVTGGLLLLLAHPDSRARIEDRGSRPPSPGRSVAALDDRFR